jgi:hypothetical protein
MTVCKHWKFVIEEHSLCRTVRLTKVLKLTMLLKQLRQNPRKGQKLERLILDWQQGNTVNFNSLMKAFPNLRSLTTFQSCRYKTPQEGQFTWDSIERIEEYASHYLTEYILKQQTCTHLTKIIGKFEHGSVSTLIKLLANAPSLRYLTLTSATWTLDDFETLHTKAPLLKSLELQRGTIRSDKLPPQVNPAPFLNVLNMDGVSLSNVAAEIKLLQYFAAKYPNIGELTYRVLKSERLVSGTQEKKEYVEEWAAFMKSIGSKLTQVSLVLANKATNMFQILDVVNCRIKKMTIIGPMQRPDVMELSISHQTQSIQQLVVLGLNERFPFNCLGTFTALKHLTVSYSSLLRPYISSRDRRFYCFTEMLNNDNVQLKSLVLAGADIKFEHLHLEQGYPLRELGLSNCRIPPHLDSFISHNFPQLHTLSFDSCTFDDKSLVFTETSLCNFKLVCRLSKSFNSILVISLKHNERRRYSATPCHFNHLVDGQDPFIYPAMISQPDDTMSDPFLTFTFNSVRNCFLMNSIY